MLDKTAVAETCFHCGEIVPKNSHWSVNWKNIQRPMCCPGCEAVCETILDSGLEEYYLHRENKPIKPEIIVPNELKQIIAYNRPEISKVFTESDGSRQQATFYINGMTCAACAWLIEKQVTSLPFVENISVNAISNLANISWHSKNNPNNESSHMGDILACIRNSGYSAKPLLREQLELEHKASQKDLLKRLGLAGLGMMQVMMFAVGLYSGAFQGMDQKIQIFLKWLSWLVATPVVLYSAAPFFKAAWNNLKSFDLGMNVPVSIAIASAYLVSSYNTFTEQGEVYFDSAVMFTFFLLIGRFLQSRAGWRASQTNLTTSLATAPTVQVKVKGLWQYLPTTAVNSGDIILVPAGDSIAVDGIILKGSTKISSAIINGEFEPRLFRQGDTVYAGSINQTEAIEIGCTETGADRYIEKLAKRQQQALAEKPSIVSLADVVSHWFVLLVICVAFITAIFWSIQAPQQAFWITLSVLVVSCPCALSLATPAAMTAAIARASKIGFLINKPELFEQLNHNQWIAFDKTGTLSEGKLTLTKIDCFIKNISEKEILSICIALEMVSNHPIAHAFRNAASQTINESQVLNRHEIHSKGVAATIAGVDYRLGNFDLDTVSLVHKSVSLYKRETCIARIYLDDPFRAEAKQTIQDLKKQGLKIALLSGDPSIDVIKIKRQFDLDEILCAASAEEKLNWVKHKQNKNQSVIMVGDGLNDGPVLAQANVSIAMAQGAALSRQGSDAILLNENLSSLLKLLKLGMQTKRVIKQNLSWAVLYNFSTIPLAASGYIKPWLAALGMSLSSLFVVLNALRLNYQKREK
jgi:Cu2+-exporting ATPase